MFAYILASIASIKSIFTRSHDLSSTYRNLAEAMDTLSSRVLVLERERHTLQLLLIESNSTIRDLKEQVEKLQKHTQVLEALLEGI